LSSARLTSIPEDSFDLVSVDVFDTLLLRDHTVQRWRFLELARELSRRLPKTAHPVDVRTLLTVRHLVHDLTYRAVALDRPQGDVQLTRMAEIQASLLGLDKSAVALFLDVEKELECRHLTGNRQLCQTLRKLSRQGKRTIAVSDTYLSERDLRTLINNLIPDAPIQQIYSSSDLGLTKHSGRVFERVAMLEGVPAGRIVHCGDDIHSDSNMARAAGWQAVLIRRPAWMRLSRKLFAMFALLQTAPG
jgi:predicted HAD superfamily hydrolase